MILRVKKYLRAVKQTICFHPTPLFQSPDVNLFLPCAFKKTLQTHRSHTWIETSAICAHIGQCVYTYMPGVILCNDKVGVGGWLLTVAGI